MGRAAEQGFLDTNAIFIDGTQIKANANLKKNTKKAVRTGAKKYAKELREEINADREAHDKRPFDDGDDNDRTPPKAKIITVSTTDPESGIFHKGKHKKCFAYEAHTACDKNNLVLEASVMQQLHSLSPV